MAIIGQIVYNLQDHSNGSVISTSAANLNTTVSSLDSNYDSAKINIFSDNLVSKYGASFQKLGIQAAPGTKVMINGNKTIMIGRTGVYELDEDVLATSLYFIRPYKYILNTVETEKNLTEGISGFEKAEEKRATSLASLNNEYSGKEKDSNYWSRYTNIQAEYETAYNEAFSKYISGINGVYQLPNPDNLNDDNNYEDLYNVIIDFIY